MRIKESSKKLSWLFKENKNINEDLIKVNNERNQVEEFMNRMLKYLEEE